MPRIKQFRETVDAKLVKLDARADAFEAALNRSKERVGERIKGGKQEVQRALDRLKAEVEKLKNMSEERKQKIRSGIDNLKVQLALGKAEASDTLGAARKRLREVVRNVETDVDAGLVEAKDASADALDAAIAIYVRAMDKLDAEFEAAEVRFAASKEKAGAAFDKKRLEIRQALADFKQKLAGKKEHESEKLVAFEEELRGGFAQAAKAFRDLFS